ncbi:DNA-3-methyladenine glycosylase [Vogesella sp. LIG4]|uniref:DNA-3-methyladenine glycosylase family protein n=1 Tax=Vogesella sp. LIG4 TaxID=1192162 RepID=UPI00081FC3CC|nr:AlkA N-terminal domain-containing protein [Vogesella sp. LIG4]SCK30837.1 DNA-3-methyladenine glycosylase II [Vogesella sp. LIG4]
MTLPLHCRLPLPANFRADGFLDFHRRDAQQLAERVSGQTLEKGLLWRGLPALLRVALYPGHAEASLLLDGSAQPDDAAQLATTVRHMLGLTQPVEAFEAALADHPQLGPLLARQSGLRVPQTASAFEALAWAIIGQQISVAAAVSIRRRFIQAAGQRHSSGLYCLPDADCVAAMDEATLRGAGCTQGKAQTLLRLAAAVAGGELPLAAWQFAPDAAQIGKQLATMRGIGPWTISYALLRGFAWLDGSLHGDVAVRRNLQRLLGRSDKLEAAEVEAWLAPFAPWRALVAAHLWALQSSDGY